MATPLDIIAAAVHAAQCGCGTVEQPARDVAQVALHALTDERVADHIAAVLTIRGQYDVTGPGGLDGLVREVLRLAGEA